MTTRSERKAKNEAVLRDANERLLEWPENRRRAAEDRPVAMLCECPSPSCDQELELTAAEYDHVRAHPQRFVLADGHDHSEIERVVEYGDGYVIVEKHDDVREITEATDPRNRSASKRADVSAAAEGTRARAPAIRRGGRRA